MQMMMILEIIMKDYMRMSINSHRTLKKIVRVAMVLSGTVVTLNSEKICTHCCSYRWLNHTTRSFVKRKKTDANYKISFRQNFMEKNKQPIKTINMIQSKSKMKFL